MKRYGMLNPPLRLIFEEGFLDSQDLTPEEAFANFLHDNFKADVQIRNDTVAFKLQEYQTTFFVRPEYDMIAKCYYINICHITLATQLHSPFLLNFKQQ
jgi:hypothetical protein